MNDKDNKYNNGSVLPFSFIKENREEAVSEIAEGNIGLEKLLNYCLDNNIVTHTSCGESGFIGFTGLDNRIFKMFDELMQEFGSYTRLNCYLEPDTSKFNAILRCPEAIDSSYFFSRVVDAFEMTSKSREPSQGEILTNQAFSLLDFSSYVRYDVCSQELPKGLTLDDDTYYCFELYNATIPDEYRNRVVFEPYHYILEEDGFEAPESLSLPDYNCYYGERELYWVYAFRKTKVNNTEKK